MRENELNISFVWGKWCFKGYQWKVEGLAAQKISICANTQRSRGSFRPLLFHIYLSKSVYSSTSSQMALVISSRWWQLGAYKWTFEIKSKWDGSKLWITIKNLLLCRVCLAGEAKDRRLPTCWWTPWWSSCDWYGRRQSSPLGKSSDDLCGFGRLVEDKWNPRRPGI